MAGASDLPARIRLFLESGVDERNRETARSLLTLARRDSLDPALSSETRAELRGLARQLHDQLLPPVALGVLTF